MIDYMLIQPTQPLSAYPPLSSTVNNIAYDKQKETEKPGRKSPNLKTVEKILGRQYY